MLLHCLGQTLIKDIESNMQHTIKKKANSIGNILRRNCLLRHVTEGKMQERQKVREDDEECWNLKEGAPYRTI
jgi:hypothetical protein